MLLVYCDFVFVFEFVWGEFGYGALLSRCGALCRVSRARCVLFCVVMCL